MLKALSPRIQTGMQLESQKERKMPALAKDSHPTLTASGILPGTPGKPDPAVLLRAMKALNTPLRSVS